MRDLFQECVLGLEFEFGLGLEVEFGLGFWTWVRYLGFALGFETLGEVKVWSSTVLGEGYGVLVTSWRWLVTPCP